MAYIISVVNQKGGVGKTTTAVNLAVYLAQHGKYVLLVDLDPQGNASSGLGLEKDKLEYGLYDALIGEKKIDDVTLKLPHDEPESLRIVPATIDLAGANVELMSVDRREFRLYDLLLEVRNNYDYIIVDSPPSLGLLTLNGLVAADEVLIPVQAEYYALEGLGQLMKSIELVKEHLKPNLEILGAVLTMFDKRIGLSEAVLQELYKHFPQKIFRSIIPRNVRLAEAPSYGQSIWHYDPGSKGGEAYQQLAIELMTLKEGEEE